MVVSNFHIEKFHSPSGLYRKHALKIYSYIMPSSREMVYFLLIMNFAGLEAKPNQSYTPYEMHMEIEV